MVSNGREGLRHEKEKKPVVESSLINHSQRDQSVPHPLPEVPNSNSIYHSDTQAMDTSNSIGLMTLSEDLVQGNSTQLNQQRNDATYHSSVPHTVGQRQNSNPVPEPTVPESQLNIAKVATFEAERGLQLSLVRCEEFERKVKELSGFLKSAEETIFRLQPYQQSINESDAIAAYASLYLSVQSWVDMHLGNAIEDRIIFTESTFDSRSASDLLNLVSPVGKVAFSCENTDEYNVIAVIMQFLKIQIFDKDFYCPVDPRSMDFLASIEKSMRSLVPQRDAATIRSWRSETFNALANRPDFEAHRADRIRQLTTELAQMLRIFIPREDKREIQASIKTAITEKAVDLAHKLQLSVDEFYINWTEYAGGHDSPAGYQMSNADQFECVNLLAGGRIVKFPEDKAFVRREPITYILDICPGLYCRNVRSDAYPEAKVLKAPVILVAMAKPEQPSFQFLSPGGLNSTLLGSIYNQLHVKQKSMPSR